MQKAAIGNQNARAELYDKYLPIITAYAASINGRADSSEDIAQKVFRRLLQKISDYHPTSSAKTYLLKFARNIIQEQRQKPQHQTLVSDYIDAMVDVSNPVTILRKKLPDKQRQAVKPLYYSNTSIATLVQYRHPLCIAAKACESKSWTPQTWPQFHFVFLCLYLQHATPAYGIL